MWGFWHLALNAIAIAGEIIDELLDEFQLLSSKLQHNPRKENICGCVQVKTWKIQDQNEEYMVPRANCCSYKNKKNGNTCHVTMTASCRLPGFWLRLSPIT